MSVYKTVEALAQVLGVKDIKDIKGKIIFLAFQDGSFVNFQVEKVDYKPSSRLVISGDEDFYVVEDSFSPRDNSSHILENIILARTVKSPTSFEFFELNNAWSEIPLKDVVSKGLLKKKLDYVNKGKAIKNKAVVVQFNGKKPLSLGYMFINVEFDRLEARELLGSLSDLSDSELEKVRVFTHGAPSLSDKMNTYLIKQIGKR